ncbi:MAG: molybdopterin molybdotransferase MoeA [Candidatus Thermoplasmatota archaeon]|jgi:molybdopterin molybdotransferase|nr:molybdopterin molybdotransferase MoeA [Candidatus Thermoplasmatota archaeon]MEC7462186.1 molybdopterin molybdotransferase MoeA [Candidatus Thermoplasmatota archaeon]MEC7543866.1 molybdopterin molybdotransferase MoeA [Candidatus Thermoplasmatota archaeon]MEC7602117.1 molybdopterin molybdotransferase MoeA [Candidatus Thermoplasmatota archaeon]MEC8721011.1 molybdopterin molybdotransferase MoeA [Candidatus Thermoplasmatota archaeon]|tara:strand:- start:166 stop:1308 length:1143 start_codon:yes stop_codon:yes gene_type:complete
MNVSIDRALEILSNFPILSDTEVVNLNEAYNRILSEDMNALVDSPPFDNSSIDGWAILDTDNPDDRQEVETIFAGDTIPRLLQPGEAFRIMTGAPIPPNAEALVMVEDGLHGVARKNFIRRKGENISKGMVALEKNTILTSASLSLLATIGHSQVPVYSPPKVSIISTGDELVIPGKTLNPGQIYESNSILLSSLLQKAGAISTNFKSSDNIDSLRELLDQCAKSSDLILTSGGVSMGDHDFVRRLLIEEGDPYFWKIKMRPGGPPIFGMWKGTPILGLPGNPVSTHIVFLNLVVPWLSNPTLFYKKIRVRLKSKIKGAPDKTVFRRLKIHSDNELTATTHTHQGSGNINSMVVHDALSILPPNTTGEVGDIIEALWLID